MSETREGKKTAVAAVTTPSPKRGARWITETALIVLGIVVIIVLAAFAINHQSNQNEPTVPTLAVLAAVPSATPVLVATNPILDPTSTFPPTWTSVPTVPIAAEAPTLPPPTHLPPPEQPIGQAGANLPPPTLRPIPMPDLGLSDAQAALDQGDSFIGNYLALYRAQLQAGDVAAAGRTLAEGAKHAPFIDAYWMTAADIAVSAGNDNLAFLCYSNALGVAEGGRAYELVRWTAGEYLYRAATQIDRLTLAEIRGLSQELAQNNSPIVNAMIGRAFLTNGNDRLAGVSIAKALTLNNELPEGHLVYGELLQAQNDAERARHEWQLALDAPDAPDWVREHATELLSSLK